MSARVNRIYSLVRPGLFTLNLGSGETSMGGVNLDVESAHRPDLIADATTLPIRDESFDQVVFADVVEHLPAGSESRAVSEIHRILRPGGLMVFSTPNDRTLYTLLDPAHHFSAHRHYRVGLVRKTILDAGFDIIKGFTAGGPLTCVDNFFVMGTNLSKNFRRPWLTRRVKDEYSMHYGERGYTIFVVSRKPLT